MHRRLLLIGVVAALLLGVTGTAKAAPATGPFSLTYYDCNSAPLAIPGFTYGSSVDGGHMAITLDGANCYANSPNPNGIFAVGFTNYWNQPLGDVLQLKMSTLGAGTLTQGGSPRISVMLEDNVDDPTDNGEVLYLDPRTCGKANGAGWITSDFRHGWDCTITDSDGHTYTGTKAYKVNGVNVPAVSAWDYMLVDHPGDRIWFAFAIADQPTVNRIDKIQLDAKVFTKN